MKRGGSREKTVALIVGAFAAGTVVASGGAAADPGARADHSSSGRNADGGGNSVGRHKIDPYGYSHVDANPLRQNEHQQNLREYHQRQNRQQPTENITGSNAGSQSWTPMARPDGSGWTVCPPMASWC
ncbi:hypothetical protein [Nocardia sp. NBC_00403]|uniref:hypothetical protein n=1 Tax=Nocardia sp. NBC_00403 TaxID=2975990 RepID=UPI002E22BAC7